MALKVKSEMLRTEGRAKLDGCQSLVIMILSDSVCPTFTVSLIVCTV